MTELKETSPNIEDLAIIGDRRTAALVDKHGRVVWYCPEQFDAPTLFASLLDAEKGGHWALSPADAAKLSFTERRYLEQSGVLTTTLSVTGGAQGPWQITDFMPLGDGLPRGLCRRFSLAPASITFTLRAAPNYARDTAKPHTVDGGVCITKNSYLYASAALSIDGAEVRFTLPQGEAGWAFLSNEPLAQPSSDEVDGWLETTLVSWRKIGSHSAYEGPYQREVNDSLRALRLLTFDDEGGAGGGIIAAATSSLPEVLGGERNYDYRYVWLRDAGMGVRALLHEDSDGAEGKRFLNFIATCAPKLPDKPMPPFFTVAGHVAPGEFALELSGYKNSRPVNIGNGANKQLQLDGYGDVLLAACLVYERCYEADQKRENLPHWDTMRGVADFLAGAWREPDYGIWEEREKKQYTVGKVLTACSLEAMARFAPEDDAARWRSVSREIRDYVAQHCLTPDGAYAAVVGGEAVDVSAALFPVWGYAEADTPEMVATVKAIEQLSSGPLYHRHLERFDSAKEGTFLAATLWVAHYWVLRRDFVRARSILDAVLGYANDLGLWSEEADRQTGQALGNFPQTITHSAFISAVLDLRRLERSP